jgi:tetratricopeptide (TPR) repeat protein
LDRNVVREPDDPSGPSPDALLRLAEVAFRAGADAVAERHLREAVRLDPGNAGAHAALGHLCCEAGRVEAALAHTATALELDPVNPLARTSRALALTVAGRPAEAWPLIEPVVAGGTADPWVVRLYAQLAPAIGHERPAAERVLTVLSSPGVPSDARPLLHYAAAQLLERLGRYDEAFDHARRANDLFRRPHDPASVSAFVSRSIDYFTPGQMASLPRATHGDRRPVFIVGLPRSGTTLVEQVLSSHPQVYGAGELETLRDLVASAPTSAWGEGMAYPECLDLLSVQQADALAAKYLAALPPDSASAACVTDKMPANAQYLPMAELLFPGCHVIHCVRNPLDTCVSCYFTDFGSGNAFSFDLQHLGAYYRDHRRLMEHWKTVLRVPVLDVRYEDLVLATRQQTRRMLEFLGLPWDERCVRFFESGRTARTSSRDQVRRPIYASSIARWKHYEKHLAPLIAALAEPAPPAGAGGTIH